MTHLIVCRARVSDECYDGSPTKRQFGEDEPMSADNTYDGQSIVCDACYLMLQPFTKSGHALNEELPAAIEHLRAQLSLLRGHDDPAQLVTEAEKAIGDTSPGTPYHRSASAMKRLAEAEIERRKDGSE